MVLAIDYGRKRIGLALSDETETIATALNTIKVTTLEKAVKEIGQIIGKYKVKKVLVGIPLGIDEKPTQMSLEVERFTKILKENVKIQIIFWNETLTSNIAKVNQIDRKGIDSHSARIILQEYLDHEK